MLHSCHGCAYTGNQPVADKANICLLFFGTVLCIVLSKTVRAGFYMESSGFHPAALGTGDAVRKYIKCCDFYSDGSSFEKMEIEKRNRFFLYPFIFYRAISRSQQARVFRYF